jgi:amino-acid N-acetyltransferase
MKNNFSRAGESNPPIEPVSEQAEILPLLCQCALPVSDISPEQALEFFSIRNESGLQGVVGIERFGRVGLLRSLAVSPEIRGLGQGHRLVDFVERYAARYGIENLYLLTTTAAGFFAKLGYAATARDEAPPVIQATTQFSGLCPASSNFMSKHLSVSLPSSGNAMSQLSPREIELVAIGAAVGSNCIPCVEYHIGAGKQLGISDDEIRAAMALADKVRRAPARKVLDAAKAAIEGAQPPDAESASRCAEVSSAANSKKNEAFSK